MPRQWRLVEGMPASPRAEVKVGIAVLVTLVLAFVAVKAIRSHGIARNQRPLTVVFGELAESLPEGSPVKLAGVAVGRVEKLELVPPVDVGGPPPGFEDAELVVALRCRVEGDALIRDSYQATVRSGFPLGEPYVDIMPTGSGGRELGASDVLIGTAEPGITDIGPLTAATLKEVEAAAHDVAVASEGVGGAAEQVIEGMTVLKDLLGDEELNRDLRQGLAALADAGESLTRVSASLEELFADEENKARFQSMLVSAERAAANLEQITANVARVTGDINNLANLESMLEDSATAAAEFAQLGASLNEILDEETRESARAAVRSLRDACDILLEFAGDLEAPEADGAEGSPRSVAPAPGAEARF